jgi:hypothetical protein
LYVDSTQNGILSRLSLDIGHVLCRELVRHAPARDHSVDLVSGDLLEPGPRPCWVTARLVVSPGAQRGLLGHILGIAM